MISFEDEYKKLVDEQRVGKTGSKRGLIQKLWKNLNISVYWMCIMTEIRRINITLPKKLVEKTKVLIEEGLYSNFSELVKKNLLVGFTPAFFKFANLFEEKIWVTAYSGSRVVQYNRVRKQV